MRTLLLGVFLLIVGLLALWTFSQNENSMIMIGIVSVFLISVGGFIFMFSFTKLR